MYYINITPSSQLTKTAKDILTERINKRTEGVVIEVPVPQLSEEFLEEAINTCDFQIMIK